jgi:hypothetical protein
VSEVCDILERRSGRCVALPGQHLQRAVLESELVEPFPMKAIIYDPVGRLGRGSQSSLDLDEDLIDVPGMGWKRG